MKKTIVTTIMLAGVFFAFAQQNVNTKVAASASIKTDRAKEQTEVLTQTLSLSAEQRDKVNAVCQEYFAAREQYLPLKATNEKEFLAKMKAVQETEDAKMNTLLSKEQLKKYGEYKKDATKKN